MVTQALPIHIPGDSKAEAGPALGLTPPESCIPCLAQPPGRQQPALRAHGPWRAQAVCTHRAPQEQQ